MKVFHLPLSEFQDLGMSNLRDILFSLCCKALCPLVNKCNVSAIIFLLEENVVVRREKQSTQYAVLPTDGGLGSD